jgi:hypothetical protein
MKALFGQNRWITDSPDSGREVLCQQRGQLIARLEAYLKELRVVGLDVEVLVDGSFVTEKPDPNDIDLILVLPAGHDFSRNLPPPEYNLLSKRRIRESGYPFDILVVGNGDTAHAKALLFFQQVRNRDDLTKGLLRVQS